MAFSKELPALFEVKIPVDQYTNTNDGLNKAFNRLIQKLSGSRSKKFLWRIGDTQLNKIEFVSSYSTELIGEEEFLSVKFNVEALIPELRKVGIPLIGFNRPVIMILLKWILVNQHQFTFIAIYQMIYCLMNLNKHLWI